jgi:subfamily B ATP-binding cassette protein MsbA
MWEKWKETFWEVCGIDQCSFMLISTLVSLFFLSPEMTLFLYWFPVMGTMIALVGKSLKRFSRSTE